jgi:hypothetical protein
MRKLKIVLSERKSKVRKIIVWLLFSFLICMTSGCASDINQVKDYNMNSFLEANKGAIRTFTEEDEVCGFATALKKAKKEPGIADIADPEYKVMIVENTYYLWLSDNSGTLMHLEDTLPFIQ